MRIGYYRVSTLEQNTARQEIAMKQLNVDTMFIEKESGKNTDRPELKKMLSFVRSGDILFIESISRLARSVKDLLNINTSREIYDHNFCRSRRAGEGNDPAKAG